MSYSFCKKLLPCVLLRGKIAANAALKSKALMKAKPTEKRQPNPKSRDCKLQRLTLTMLQEVIRDAEGVRVITVPVVPPVSYLLGEYIYKRPVYSEPVSLIAKPNSFTTIEDCQTREYEVEVELVVQLVVKWTISELAVYLRSNTLGHANNHRLIIAHILQPGLSNRAVKKMLNKAIEMVRYSRLYQKLYEGK